MEKLNYEIKNNELSIEKRKIYFSRVRKRTNLMDKDKDTGK